MNDAEKERALVGKAHASRLKNGRSWTRQSKMMFYALVAQRIGKTCAITRLMQWLWLARSRGQPI